ncbi:hypothetical protein D3C85_1790490 [compost metagenome]
MPSSKLLIMPPGLVKSIIMPQITISEIKCGRYETVCRKDFSFLSRSSLSRSAKASEAGKMNSSE